MRPRDPEKLRAWQRRSQAKFQANFQKKPREKARTKPLQTKPLQSGAKSGAGSGTKIDAKKGGLRKVSKKGRAEQDEYKLVREAYLARHPWCQHCIESQAASHLPLRPATEVHHTAGKVGAMRCDTRFFMAVAAACHTMHQGSIHENPAYSREKGWLLTRSAPLERKLETLQEKRGHWPHVQRELALYNLAIHDSGNSNDNRQ